MPSRVRALNIAALLSALALLAGCGGNSVTSSPSPVPQPQKLSFAGLWQVSYNGTFGGGCNTPGRGTQATVFRLAQDGQVVSGTIFNAEVSGTVAADGSVTLTGSTSEFGRTDTARAVLQPNADQSAFGGSLNMTFATPGTFCNGFIDAQIVDAHRVQSNMSVTNFQGTWEGFYAVQDCSFVGWTFCYPAQKGSLNSFYLQLTQSGAAVSGTLVLNHGSLPVAAAYGIPVTGTVSGNQLTLQGMLAGINQGEETITLTSWSTTRDALGHMTGTFSHIDAFDISKSIHNSTTSQDVLAGVTLDVP